MSDEEQPAKRRKLADDPMVNHMVDPMMPSVNMEGSAPSASAGHATPQMLPPPPITGHATPHMLPLPPITDFKELGSMNPMTGTFTGNKKASTFRMLGSDPSIWFSENDKVNNKLGGSRRKRNSVKRTRRYKKGSKSNTMKGGKGFTTKKRSKYFDRRGHRSRHAKRSRKKRQGRSRKK